MNFEGLDVIGNTEKVMRIATDEKPEVLGLADDCKDPAAMTLDKKGDAARAARVTPERRVEIAKKRL